MQKFKRNTPCGMRFAQPVSERKKSEKKEFVKNIGARSADEDRGIKETRQTAPGVDGNKSGKELDT
jgi:hypothetical protein